MPDFYKTARQFHKTEQMIFISNITILSYLYFVK